MATRTPAKVAEAGVLRKLTLQQFGGQTGEQFTAALFAELSAVQVEGTAFYTAVTFAAPAGGPMAAGRAAGADGVISGEISPTVQEANYQGLTLGCLARNANGCVRFGLVPTACVRRILQLVANIRLLRVSDGRIIYSVSKSNSVTANRCAGQTAAKSDPMLYLELQRPITAAVRQDIAPVGRSVKVKLEDDSRGLSKDLAGRFKASVKLASSSFSAACANWRDIDAASPNHPSIVYDIGLCSEQAGDYQGANTFYRRSQALLPAADVAPAEALVRVAGRQSELDELAKQDQRRKQADEDERRQAAETARAQRAAEATERTRAAAERARGAAQAASAQAAQAAKRQSAIKKYGAGAADAIIAGRVQKGMTTQQVLAAKGSPRSREAITAGNEQWFYPDQRVIFTNGRVSYIGS